MSKAITVKVTSAFTLGDGEIARPGEIVELTRSEAANLLHRGKVELVDAADAPQPAEVLSTASIAGDQAPAPKPRKRKGKAADAQADGEDDADGEDGDA